MTDPYKYLVRALGRDAAKGLHGDQVAFLSPYLHPLAAKVLRFARKRLGMRSLLFATLVKRVGIRYRLVYNGRD